MKTNKTNKTNKTTENKQENKTTKKKRCSKGYRREKKTDECIFYTKIKVFKELSDQTISETKNTISLEKVGENGSIIKLYNKGELYKQTFVSNQDLEKSKKNGKSDMNQMMKLIHKLGKDPTIIQKDKKFKKFKRKMERMRGGSALENNEEMKTEVLIQEGIMENIKGEEFIKEEEKTDELQSNKSTTWLEDTWSWMGSNLMGITTVVHLFDAVMYGLWAAGEITMKGTLTSFFLPFTIDCVGMLTISIMNILGLYYPSNEMEQYNIWTQYIIYTLIIGTGILLFPHHVIGMYSSWLDVPNIIWVEMSGALGLFSTIVEEPR